MANSDQTTDRYPLKPLVDGWWKKIRLGLKFKKEHFQDAADEAMKFYECGQALHQMMFKKEQRLDVDDDLEGVPAPTFRMIVGKTSEVVQLYGPSLYPRNPSIVVEVKDTDIPIDLLIPLIPPETIQQAQMQAQAEGRQFSMESLLPEDESVARQKVIAWLIQTLLNYYQRENDKKTHAMRAIDEALIKGRGILWCETFQAYQNGPESIRSAYDTVDNYVIDPDCETPDEARWIARKCLSSTWEFAEEYDLDHDDVKKRYGTDRSADSESDDSDEAEHDRKIGESHDLIEYYKVYSKMGMGHKLSRIQDMEDLFDDLDSLGPYRYVVIAEKIPYPVNLKPKALKQLRKAQDPMKTRAWKKTNWPIPFWLDGTWPASPLDYHQIPNNPWPMSHIKPGLCYLRFINWCMSFLANRIRHSCRTIVSVQAQTDDKVVMQIRAGRDFDVLHLPKEQSADGDIRKLIGVLQMPEVNGEIWKVIEAAMQLFEKATGLNDLAYGSSGGMRSAAEANIKEGNRSIRPEDMAQKTEDWLSLVARREAMAAQWLLSGEQVQKILGTRGAKLWDSFVAPMDPQDVAREYNYRVEAGTTRKPNKETRVAQMNEFFKSLGPVLFPIAMQTGDVGLINAAIKRWCAAMDIESKDFLLPPPPPPPPDPNAAKVQAEIALKEKEHELKQQESQVKLQTEAMKAQLDVQATQAKTQAQVEQAHAKMQIEREKAQQEQQINQQQMLGDMQMQRMEMGFKQQEAQMGHAQQMQQMHMQERQGQQQMAMEGQRHSMDLQHGQQQHQQTLQQGAASHRQQLQQGAAAGQQKLKLGEQQAKAKMKRAAVKKPAAKKKRKGKK